MPAAETGAELEDEWLDQDDETETVVPELDSDDDDETDSDEVDGEEGTEALDKLEAEELEMLTEDEAAEALPVDEAEELRQIRREAIALEAEAEDPQDDEFVCSTCFLVKRTSQLANRRKKLCKDCI